MLIGCNYWAGYAGVNMWRDWRPEAIAAELDALAEIGVRKLRVFPSWREFQPLEYTRTVMNWPRDLTLHGEKLPAEAPGCHGVDAVMLDRLQELLDLAHQRKMRVSVGLITGWMSGQMLVPSAFADRDLITDPLVVRWQLALIRAIVGRFKSHPAIDSWGPGNETNCLQRLASRHQAALWMQTIADAIRAEDGAHPVISGMHGLAPLSRGRIEQEGPVWTIQDNAEIFDALTVHPYPFFTPYCALSRLDEFRNLHHASAELTYYGTIGKRPCIVEEIGAFSGMCAGEQVKYDYLRGTMWNCWAHGSGQFLWWCGSDHTFVHASPYTWSGLERELGMLDENGRPLPFSAAYSEFNRVLDGMPTPLPPAQYDAVCVLTDNQDNWANAFGCHMLAEQAGLRVRFAWHGDPLPESRLYFVPGIVGASALEQPEYESLLERAHAGARVVFTSRDGLLAPSVQYFGFEPQFMEGRDDEVEVRVHGNGGDFTFKCRRGCHYRILPGKSHVLAQADGEPVLFENGYGKGSLAFFCLPVEEYATTSQDAINNPDAFPAYRLYEMLADGFVAEHPARPNHPKCQVSCHMLDDDHGYVVAVNNSLAELEKPLRLADGWGIEAIYRGDAVRLPAHDALVAAIRRKR